MFSHLVHLTPLGNLGLLLEASFGSNLVYAALLGLGKLQGEGRAKGFAAAMLVMAMLSLVGLFAAAIAPDRVLLNWVIIISSVILFAPVPVSLVWTLRAPHSR